MLVKKHISSSEINALEFFRIPWTMAVLIGFIGRID